MIVEDEPCLFAPIAGEECMGPKVLIRLRSGKYCALCQFHAEEIWRLAWR